MYHPGNFIIPGLLLPNYLADENVRSFPATWYVYAYTLMLAKTPGASTPNSAIIPENEVQGEIAYP
jgi:hypothetical protein